MPRPIAEVGNDRLPTFSSCANAGVAHSNRPMTAARTARITSSLGRAWSDGADSTPSRPGRQRKSARRRRAGRPLGRGGKIGSMAKKICDTILDTIGDTPMVRLNRIPKGVVAAEVVAKIETFNPGNSIKDRMAVKMIEDAERDGRLKPGGTIIEGTSGNTGMGLAIAAVVKGYHCIFTTTDKQSKEKVDALRAFGADVIVCPTDVEPEDPRSYYSVSSRLERETPNSWKANQYDNPSNAQAHYEQTGPEIWDQTDGRVDHLVVGVGTGGTICGVGKYLKEKKPGGQGLGHRHLRVGVQEVQGDRRLRQERDLPVHHRGHRRGLPAPERRLQRHRPLREGDRPRRRDHDQPHRPRGRHLRRQLGRLGDGRPAAAGRRTSRPASWSSSSSTTTARATWARCTTPTGCARRASSTARA